MYFWNTLSTYFFKGSEYKSFSETGPSKYLWTFYTWELAVYTLCCHLMRLKLYEADLPQKIRSFSAEFLACVDVCGSYLQYVSFASLCNGFWSFIIYHMVLFLWWGYTLPDTSTNPDKIFEDVVRGQKTYKEGLKSLLVEVAGGGTAIAIIRLVRYLEAYGKFSGIPDKTCVQPCDSELVVWVGHGFLVECTITFADRFVGLLAEEKLPFLNSIWFRPAYTTFLCYVGMDLTGSYFNPLIATVINYRCDGHTCLQFITVYWVGSLLGTALSLAVYAWIVDK